MSLHILGFSLGYTEMHRHLIVPTTALATTSLRTRMKISTCWQGEADCQVKGLQRLCLADLQVILNVVPFFLLLT